MAEQLAMYETRFLIEYVGGRMQKMYADLCIDIKHKTDIIPLTFFHKNTDVLLQFGKIKVVQTNSCIFK